MSTRNHRTCSLLAVLVAMTLASAPAFAGETYSFTHERIVKGDPVHTKGRVLAEGTSYRVELEPDGDDTRTYQAVVSRDGGTRELALNLENRTFYELKPQAGPSSDLLWLVPVPGRRSAKHVKLDPSTSPETERVSEVEARRYQVTVSYDLTVEIAPPPALPHAKSDWIRGKVTVKATLWMVDGRPTVLPRLLRPEIRSDLPEVDEKLAGAMASIQGFPVQWEVTISTSGDQYTPPRSSTEKATLQLPKPTDTQPALFEVPKGFTEHEPKFEAPGMSALTTPPPSSSATSWR